ncbi:biotin transporter BioY [Alkaliphilus sp. MSJ-5]|uniref:Biotin transporter n=1 Tax=Alkaliphilus flagellatus TaxID=2841507 RepID=A0ABS6G5H0_9FIRM|nr:biotin transporter BioY [Alkaliphilus flagellatus]MBU5677738.1 biotin transporter BioY [Alkaliphilus flagellatus]
MGEKANINKATKISISEMTKISLCTALLCISSYILLPLPFTPIMITAQTIVVNLIALTLKPIHSVISIVMFILLGVIGLPVFAGGIGGLGALFGPTGGFIIGFIFSAIAISYLKGKKINLVRYLLVTILIGMPITYLFGATYMSYVLNMGYIKTLQVAVIPFIVGDIIKATLASIIALKLNSI